MPSPLTEARSDRAMIDKIETAMRGYLFAALSEARTLSVGMEPRLRDRLMDDLTKEFNPDGMASDLFTDGFYDAKNLADELIEIREGEQKNPVREAAE